MINKINNKGIGAYEVVCTCVICLIIALIILSITFKTKDNEKYEVFMSNARTFGLSVDLEDEKFVNKSEVTLKEMIDIGVMSKLKNPFIGSSKHCDLFDSRVTISKRERYVTLKCGNFIVFNQFVGDTNYRIYEITNWSREKKTSKDIVKVGYNYIVDGEKVFDDYYRESMFIYMYNEANNTNYESISQMDGVTIDKKKFYASLKLIK